ncbi:TROVE domain-containing protein [Streptomonospora litoralis]|uniref:TROVE domain protein n=1 Tax=Streptomonospora litoralis TaxID=2498135 RepID=A0A4P6PZ33_9ACTN|nr:TROVE domain-containing protein [Streptomonospora litoralis]QBI53445.1 TROVE domain protein [Streptomonospora litoralis]
MAKFNRGGTLPAGRSPVRAEEIASGATHEGAPGHARDPRSELFLLAVTNLVGEQTFYEAAGVRDGRYRTLVHRLALEDPAWLTGLIGWLRTGAHMRTAPLVAAAEMAHARTEAGASGHTRTAVRAALGRADEPGELIAYWHGRYGRRMPIALKRGVADALLDLYNERTMLKYDSSAADYRFGDVVELVQPRTHHPHIRGTWRDVLYGYAIDRRHRPDADIPGALQRLNGHARLRARAAEDPAALLDPDALRDLAFTWEQVLSIAGDRVDKVALWESVLPSMGYMATLRNLRNLDEAGVPDSVAQHVAQRLADPDQVARSKQFPFRFLTAYRQAPSLRWAYALDQALTHSLANIPTLTGRTLVMVDTSSSMHSGFSADGTMMRWDAAALFGVALAARCAAAEVVSFSSAQRYVGDPRGAHTAAFPLKAGESLLRSLDRWSRGGYFLGGGTDTAAALHRHYAGHDRVVLLTDEQAAGPSVHAAIPERVPMYTFNLAGYKRGHAPSGLGHRHTFGGLTDACFRLIPLLEAGRAAAWPWQTTADEPAA